MNEIILSPLLTGNKHEYLLELATFSTNHFKNGVITVVS